MTGFAQVAQLVEHTLGKGEVGSSNLLLGSIIPASGGDGFVERLIHLLSERSSEHVQGKI